VNALCLELRESGGQCIGQEGLGIYVGHVQDLQSRRQRVWRNDIVLEQSWTSPCHGPVIAVQLFQCRRQRLQEVVGVMKKLCERQAQHFQVSESERSVFTLHSRQTAQVQ